MASKTKTSFDLRCPCCYSEDDRITLELNDMFQVTCTGCDATFSATEARDQVAAEMAKWDRLIRFVEAGLAILAE